MIKSPRLAARKQRMAIEKAEQNYKIETNTQYMLDLGMDLGFGLGVREYPFAKIIKRKFMADVAFPAFNLLIEIEGGAYSGGRHVRGAGYEKDCEKYSIASILGFTLIRVTYGMISNGQAMKLLKMMAERKIKKCHTGI